MMDLNELEKGIFITNYAAAGDGGSLSFECETIQNEKFSVLFTQYLILDSPNPEMLPGRIYFNNKIIELKSKEEKMILSGFAKFHFVDELKAINETTDEQFIKTFARLTKFYNSNESIEIKRKVDYNLIR